MPDGLQLSARSVARLIAQAFGPAVYDALIPRFSLADLVSGSHPVPWLGAGPHPEPWLGAGHGVPWHVAGYPVPWRGERIALTLAEAHLQHLIALDQLGAVLGSEVAERALDRSLRTVAEIDEICPRWPRWPKGWPPPPPPPWQREEMTPTELFVFGARFLGAADQLEQGPLQDAVIGLGEKALGLSVRG